MRLRRVTAAVFCVGVLLVFIMGLIHFRESSVQADDPFWGRLLTASMAFNAIGLWSILLSAREILEQHARAEKALSRLRRLRRPRKISI